MKTHFSNSEYAKKVMHRMQRLATCLPPAIPFDKAEKKAEKKSENKENYKTFDIRLNKKEKDSEKVEHSVKVFEQGSPEDFCNWFERYQDREGICEYTGRRDQKTGSNGQSHF